MARLLLRGANVIDGTGGPVHERTSVLVDGSRIAAVGAAADAGVGAAPDTLVLDLAGRTILPGLIDLHVHSSFPSEMKNYLAHGVTSIRFAGIDLAAWYDISARLAANTPAGPRLFNLGPMLDRPDGAWPMWSQPFETSDEAGRAGAALIDEAGADGLIAVQQVTPADLRAIVAAAHERGKPVVGQLWRTDAAEAAEIGIDELDNTARIAASREYRGERLFAYRSVAERMAILSGLWLNVDWDETQRLMDALIGRGVAYGPTFVVMEQEIGLHKEIIEDDPLYRALFGAVEQAAWVAFVNRVIGGWGPAEYDTWLRSLDARREWIRRFHGLGGRLVVGTDMPFGGMAIQRELEVLHECGLPRLEAIAAATGWAAEVARLPDIGVIEAGRAADLLVVDGDPSEDLGALRRIALVLRDGEAVAGPLA